MFLFLFILCKISVMVSPATLVYSIIVEKYLMNDIHFTKLMLLHIFSAISEYPNKRKSIAQENLKLIINK